MDDIAICVYADKVAVKARTRHSVGEEALSRTDFNGIALWLEDKFSVIGIDSEFSVLLHQDITVRANLDLLELQRYDDPAGSVNHAPSAL